MRLRIPLSKMSLLLMSLSTSSLALADLEEEKSPWSGDAKLGFIYSKNNTSTLSINSGASLKYDQEQWHQQLALATFYSYKSDSDEDGTNKYRLIYDVKHDVSPRLFVFGNSKYEHDQYATYRHQALIVSGLGATLINTKATQVDMGFGPGFRHSVRQPSTSVEGSRSDNEWIANAFLQTKSKVSQSVSVGVSARVDYGDSNTTTSLKGTLSNKLAEKLALVFDTEYINNTTVAKGKSHDEIYSTLSLSYAF
ncbi:DUF481 domain-containing protein [Vibrio cincinnatiensis]|uniref:DUF481 domain-containing protein n=1 Tax=Vibrio cincinnatiensis TaxID=675 RepID=UPI0012AD206E|nr:DUF481 domain-containing protein [Vibrio cincinnatiensis]MCG3724681.1 DUF481 domain-containing protein [Vibrio cincinnatiensis]MCG3765605.1 DUF481 domain-containing protein [Vibrio cincinnatiensis]